MSRQIVPIDASNLPDLLKAAEEVNSTKTPRLIKRHAETLAMLMPVGAAVQRRDDHPHKRTIWTRYNPQRVRAALKQSAGALQGVDKEKLICDLASQRAQKSTGLLLPSPPL